MTRAPANPKSRRTLWQRLTPRAGAGAQLLGAALLWLVALTVLFTRGVLFLTTSDGGFQLSPLFAPIALTAVVIGVLKARYILTPYATAAVARIRQRGHTCFFGLFRWSSWAFLAAMMTVGLLLRSSPLAASDWGRALLCLTYLSIGVALFLGGLVFWGSLFGRADPQSNSSP